MDCLLEILRAFTSLFVTIRRLTTPFRGISAYPALAASRSIPMHSTWQTRHAEEFKMNNSLSIHCKLRKSQQGSSLIEVLITMLIVAVGLLGAGGMQIASTRYQQTAFMRSQAIVQAQFIAEKIRANNAVVWNAAAPDNEKYLAPDSYAAAGTLPTDPACGMTSGSTCTGCNQGLARLAAISGSLTGGTRLNCCNYKWWRDRSDGANCRGNVAGKTRQRS